MDEKEREEIKRDSICKIPCFKEAKEDYLVKLDDVLKAMDFTITATKKSCDKKWREMGKLVEEIIKETGEKTEACSYIHTDGLNKRSHERVATISWKGIKKINELNALISEKAEEKDDE